MHYIETICLDKIQIWNPHDKVIALHLFSALKMAMTMEVKEVGWRGITTMAHSSGSVLAYRTCRDKEIYFLPALTSSHTVLARLNN